MVNRKIELRFHGIRDVCPRKCSTPKIDLPSQVSQSCMGFREALVSRLMFCLIRNIRLMFIVVSGLHCKRSPDNEVIRTNLEVFFIPAHAVSARC